MNDTINAHAKPVAFIHMYTLPCSNTALDELEKRKITGFIMDNDLLKYPLNLAYSSAWMQCRNCGLGIIPDHGSNLI